MGTSLLNIAITGLNAAQSGLLTTSHNISNSSTVGFNRQNIVQTTQSPQFTGAGFLGQGTRVDTVVRSYSSFLFEQVKTSQATTSHLESFMNQLGLIDNMLGDVTVGLSPAVTAFFEGVNAVAANPSSMPSRQSLIAAGQTLVARFQDLSGRLNDIAEGTNSQIRSEIDTINSLAQQVSALNRRIAAAEAAGPGQTANDLHDQRDQLVLELSKHIRTDVLVQSDGSFSVFFGNGQPLVVGESVFSLGTRINSTDATRLMVSLVSPTGSVSELPENLLTGGALGGLLEFRSNSLDVAQNNLGRLALGVISAFNTQHRLGQDLSGNTGIDFFSMPTPAVIANINNDPAATAPGEISAQVTDIGALSTSDYILTRMAGGYTLRRIEDDTVVFSGATLPATADGLTFTVEGVPAIGSSFRIQATHYAARDIELAISDPRSIAAGLPAIASASINNVGTGTISSGTLKSPVTLTYSTALGGYTGFPAGTSVIVWDPATATSTTTVVDSSSDLVAIPAGSHATVNGITFQFSAAPANGDRFTIGPNELSEADTNTGAANISAGGHMRTTFTYVAASTALTITPMPDPLLNTTISITSGGVTTQYPIRNGTEGIPYVAGATYEFNGATFSFGGAAPSNGDTFTIGTGYATAPIPPSTTSATATLTQSAVAISADLPTSDYTLAYDNANNLLTGFPPGTTIAVTVNGVTTHIPITSPDQGIAYTNGMRIMVNGLELAFGGVPGDGDTFAVGPTSSSTTDSRNALALASVQTQKVLLGGTASIESSYAQLVSSIGNKAREINTTYDAQLALLSQAHNAQQSFSGVNLDEEAANLLRYQQAYQASAKIIDISSKLFDLLATLG